MFPSIVGSIGRLILRLRDANHSRLAITLHSHPFSASIYGSNLLTPVQMRFEQFRGRKRALKAPLSRQQKLERRLRREEKEAKKKQYTFMQRIHIRRMQKLLSPSQQYPGRYESEKEVDLPVKPHYDVFVRAEYKTQFYSVEQAVEMHRLMQMPSIYNNPNGPLKLRIELNMTTDKAVMTTDKAVIRV